MPHESDSARNNAAPEKEHLLRVREAAEALFRPKARRQGPQQAPRQSPQQAPRPAPAGALSQPSAVVREPDTRVGRLLPIQKQVGVAETPSDVERKIDPDALPKSEHSRVRVLASYGMTVGQVAELYDVTLETIEKIISKPKSGRRG